MIVHKFYLQRADWTIVLYIAVKSFYADEIIDDLIKLGCRGENLRRAKKNLWDSSLDSGLTFSNPEMRTSIIIVAKTTSAQELWNSIDHEKMHLLQDIALYDNIDLFGEEISYISGEFIREVFICAKNLLCDCCRKKIRRVL